MLDFSQTSKVRKMIEEHEGKRSRVYYDHKSIPTVGIGFNLDRPDARSILASVGADYDDIRSGKASLSNNQINKIFKKTAKQAYEVARKKIGSSRFDGLSEGKKIALTSLAFNNPSLIGPNLTKHIRNKNWDKATYEIRYKSNKNNHKGIQNRRSKEADLFKSSVNDYLKIEPLPLIDFKIPKAEPVERQPLKLYSSNNSSTYFSSNNNNNRYSPPPSPPTSSYRPVAHFNGTDDWSVGVRHSSGTEARGHFNNTNDFGVNVTIPIPCTIL